MLGVLGGLDREQGRYKEGLVVYDKAKAVLAQHKEGNNYGALLNNVAFCHERLQQWVEAVACYREAVEHSHNLHGNNHPNYATALYHLAFLFAELKQYEERRPSREWKRRLPSSRGCSVSSTSALLRPPRTSPLPPSSLRSAINVGYNFRMCSLYGAVSEIIFTCPCDHAWYCNAECQLQHWPTHKPHCSVCFYCSTLLTKVKRCSRFQTAKYCNTACQTAHWSESTRRTVQAIRNVAALAG
jgi:tetratricopeptide (TPR) repeat protein